MKRRKKTLIDCVAENSLEKNPGEEEMKEKEKEFRMIIKLAREKRRVLRQLEKTRSLVPEDFAEISALLKEARALAKCFLAKMNNDLIELGGENSLQSIRKRGQNDI